MNDQERAAFEAWLNPGRHAGNVSAWVEPGRYEKDAHNLAWLAWNARAALAAAPVQADKWEGAEEWMPLAWELCANENGEDACTELVLEGGPIPEPWGDRWLKYEDQAKEMIALVRKHVPALAAASAAPVQAVPGWALVPLHATPEMVSAAEGVEDLYKRGTPQTWAAVFRAMLAAAPAAPQVPAVPQWRPIETAPMHKAVLLWWRTCLEPAIGRYVSDERGEGWKCDGDQAIPRNQGDCTHWMPLPAAPGAPQPAEPAPRWLTKEEIDPLIEQARDAFYPADMNPHFERCLVWLALRAAGVKEPPNALAQPRAEAAGWSESAAAQG